MPAGTSINRGMNILEVELYVKKFRRAIGKDREHSRIKIMPKHIFIQEVSMLMG